MGQKCSVIIDRVSLPFPIALVGTKYQKSDCCVVWTVEPIERIHQCVGSSVYLPCVVNWTEETSALLPVGLHQRKKDSHNIYL